MIPALPAQGTTNWLPWAQALDTEARTIAEKETRHTVSVRDYGATGDGATDDTAAIQAAANAAAAANLNCFIPPGTYLINGLQVPSGLRLYGTGPTSILKLSAPDLHPIRNKVSAGFADVYLSDFAVDGNKASISGDSTIPGTPGEVIFMSSADATPATNIVVERVYVHDSKRLGIVYQNVQGGAVRNCVVDNNSRDGITLFFNCQNIDVSGNVITRCGDDGVGLNPEDGTSTGHVMKNITVRGNRIGGVASNGKGKGVAVRGGQSITIEGNTISDVNEVGVYIADYNTTPSKDIAVTGNTIIRSGQTALVGPSKNGVLIDANNTIYHASSTWAAVDGIVIAGNVLRECAGDGIALVSNHGGATDLQGVVIADNQITDTTGTAVNVATGPIKGVKIADNQIRTATVGVYVQASSHEAVTVTGNTVRACSSHGINVQTVAYVVVTANLAQGNTGVGVKVNNCTGAVHLAGNAATGNTAADFDFASVSSTVTRFQAFNSNPATKPTVTGSRGGNAALADLLTRLAALGLLGDSTTV